MESSRKDIPSSRKNIPFSVDAGLHKCRVATPLLDEARKRAAENCKGNEEEVKEAIRMSVRDVERRLIQGRLGVNMAMRGFQSQSTIMREILSKSIPVQKVAIGCSNKKKYETNETDVLYEGKLLWEQELNTITLTGLKIFPKVGEQGVEIIVGSLEVHRNGFYYRSPTFCFPFLYADVKELFFRVGDEKIPPLLHFHFRHPIKVGTEKRRHIQFRLVPNNVVERKRSYNDSDNKIHKDLKNFVQDVQRKWRYVHVLNYCAFPKKAEVCRAAEFQGNHPSNAPTVFALTSYALVGLVEEPFIVVDLKEIEIVHLELKPDNLEPVEIDMTIVFQDKLEPVQINSIPIDRLNRIKDVCNSAMVKYYVKMKDDSFWSMVKMKQAGKLVDWKVLEDETTLSCYFRHLVYCTRGEAHCHEAYCTRGEALSDVDVEAKKRWQ